MLYRKRVLVCVLPVVLYLLIVAGVIILFGATEISITFLSVLTGIGGLVVAFASALIGYWSRVDPQRQVLYQAQLEVFVRIYSLALETSSSMVDIAGEAKVEERPQRAEEVYSHFYETTRKHWLLYPKETRDLIVKFDRGLSRFVQAIRADPSADRTLRRIVLENAHTVGMLMDAFRTSLGIEKLHENTQQLLGIPEQEKDIEK